MAESHRCLIFHRVMCRKCVACHENEPPCGISHLTVTLKQLSHDAIFCLHQGKEGAWLPRFGGTGQWSRLCLGHRVWEARKPTVISRCKWSCLPLLQTVDLTAGCCMRRGTSTDRLCMFDRIGA